VSKGLNRSGFFETNKMAKTRKHNYRIVGEGETAQEADADLENRRKALLLALRGTDTSKVFSIKYYVLEYNYKQQLTNMGDMDSVTAKGFGQRGFEKIEKAMKELKYYYDAKYTIANYLNLTPAQVRKINKIRRGSGADSQEGLVSVVWTA